MDLQMAFNVAVAAISALGGWTFRSMQENIKENATKIQAIEVMIAGHYVTTSHIDKLMDAVFAQLRRIEDRLDEKVSK